MIPQNEQTAIIRKNILGKVAETSCDCWKNLTCNLAVLAYVVNLLVGRFFNAQTNLVFKLTNLLQEIKMRTFMIQVDTLRSISLNTNQILSMHILA